MAELGGAGLTRASGEAAIPGGAVGWGGRWIVLPCLAFLLAVAVGTTAVLALLTALVALAAVMSEGSFWDGLAESWLLWAVAGLWGGLFVVVVRRNRRLAVTQGDVSRHRKGGLLGAKLLGVALWAGLVFGVTHLLGALMPWGFVLGLIGSVSLGCFTLLLLAFRLGQLVGRSTDEVGGVRETRP